MLDARSAIATGIVRMVFLTLLATLALSASTVAALGLEDLRMVVFAGLLGALAAAGLLRRPRFTAAAATAPLCAAWLLGLIAVTSHGSGAGLVDYKIALPILALLVAPNLRAALGGLDLVRTALLALAFYVVASALAGLMLPSTAALRNVAYHVRVDLTGSVVLHASLCTIAAVAAAGAMLRRPARHRVLLALVVALAVGMVLLTATRTVLVTLAGLLSLALWARGRLPLVRPRTLGLALLTLTGVLLLSGLLGDTLWARLVELDRADYSSGRWPSIRHWLAQSAGAPFGLGMGTIRRTLAEGRPLLADGQLLEWPHNEFVRLYVEAGVPGLALLLVVAGEVTRLALRRARSTTDPAERALLLVLTADLWAQCLLQNYFNSVYHATVMVLLVGLLAADDQPATPPVPARQVRPAARA